MTAPLFLWPVFAGLVMVFFGLMLAASGRFGRLPDPGRERLGMIVALCGLAVMLGTRLAMRGPHAELLDVAAVTMPLGAAVRLATRWRRSR